MASAEELLDCAIIGAGPAGLTAAIYLGRYRRRVRLFQDRESRAAWIPESHNFPSWPDGVTGATLLARLGEQAALYAPAPIDRHIESLTAGQDGFVIRGGGETWRARTVLLATGVVDVEPPLPGVETAIRRALVRICPICDGFEASGQAIGVIGAGDKGAREALFLRTWSDHVCLIHVGEAGALSAAARAELERGGVELIETAIEAVEIEQDRITAFRWSGTPRAFDTVYSALGLEPRSQLAVQAGAVLAEDGRLQVGEHQETSLSGLYAAGDVVRSLNQLTVAMAEAAIAATAIHNRLRETDA